ncbi:uncharacterized protein LOC128959406 [Oppia nitens]|uniref:uncharacterized protein LOC128959406 n=1 Tax=Oppia nitens TaxID=1686743 RepID=UPI0023DB9A3E|nr:uncharacterized protein LOC128959406 [Oppia nitens]
MKYIICSIVLSIYAIYLCQSAKVLLTHRPYLNNSNTQINCTAQLDRRSEWFASLEVNKDGHIFYNYDNNTKSNPVVNQVYGIDRQAVQTYGFAPGVFVINRLNKTSSGRYTCIVKYNRGAKSAYNATDIVVKST